MLISNGTEHHKVILVATLCIFALIGLKQVWFGIRMVKPLAKPSESEVGGYLWISVQSLELVLFNGRRFS